jgi:hypothetical protein
MASRRKPLTVAFTAFWLRFNPYAKKLARRKKLYFTGRSRLPEDPSWDDGKQAGFLDFADFLDLPIAARSDHAAS